MHGWFFLFVLSIGAGGFFALLVALARTPGISELLPPQLFYHWLIGHVDLALIIGFLSFLVVLWHKVFGKEERAYEYTLAGGGAVLILLSSLLGLGTAVHNNYVPTVDHPLFFAGVGLFGLGYALTSLRFTAEAFRSLFKGGLARNTFAVSVFLSLLLCGGFLISFLNTPRAGEVYLFFERLYWLPGHIHQFINAVLLVGSWILLLEHMGAKLPSFMRYVNLFFIPFPVLYFVLQIFVENSLSPFVKELTTLGYAVGIGVPTLVYAVLVLRAVVKDTRSFLSPLSLSVVLYLFGAFMGYMIAGSDLRIPAHYHGVIASILISLMLLTYRLMTELGYIKELPRVVKLQPYLYGLGMMLFTSALFWAGVYGAPRKTFGTGYIESLKVYIFMVLMGLGSILSVIGGVIFVLFVLYSIIKRNEFRIQEETR